MTDPEDPFALTEIDPETLPWLDRPRRDIEQYVSGLPAEVDKEQVYHHLVHWLRHGYMVLEGAVSRELIEAVRADIEEMWDTFQEHTVPFASDLFGSKHQPIREYSEEEIQRIREEKGHFRICDFYHYSVAAKKIALHPRIVELLHHVLSAPPIVLQSLTFWRSTEQNLHQDLAFVPATIQSHLAASWVALEDIHPDSGPLSYVKGSHFNPYFQWGNGVLRTPKSTKNAQNFHEHQLREARLSGEEVLHFCPKMGDVFIWHGALAHGGSPVRDRALSRKSFVTHYSNSETHDYDHKTRHRADLPPPSRRELNGGFYHLHPLHPDEENKFQRGAALDA